MPRTPTTIPSSSSAVVAEVQTGDGLSLSAAARLLPPGASGRPLAPSTIWRWARDGVETLDGRRVYLEVARLGSRFVTSREAIGRFLTAQNSCQEASSAPLPPSPTPTPSSTPTKPPRQRNRQGHAGSALDQAGI